MLLASSPCRCIATVFVREGLVYANSRDVAAYFEKEHRHVLRDIDALVSEGVPNFGYTPHVNPQNGQTYRSYDMDRDGFTLLAMSFTGPKALKFKLAYITAFNALEEELCERDEDDARRVGVEGTIVAIVQRGLREPFAMTLAKSTLEIYNRCIEQRSIGRRPRLSTGPSLSLRVLS